MEDFDTWMRNTGKWKPSKPTIKKRVLTQEGEDLQAEWQSTFEGCYCATTHMPPCSACTHPGNPISIEENEDLWEFIEVEL